MKLTKKSRLGGKITAWVEAIPLLLLPCTGAFANPVANVVNNLANLMTGPMGSAVATIATIWTGYELFDGQIDKNRFFIRVLGIGVIYGGSWIVRQVTGSVI